MKKNSRESKKVKIANFHFFAFSEESVHIFFAKKNALIDNL